MYLKGERVVEAGPDGRRPPSGRWRAPKESDLMLGLLRQPGGFEGLVHRVVLVNPRDSTVPHLVEGRELELDPRAASAPDAPLPARNENALAGVDVVEVLDVILAEGLQPLPQVLDQAVQAPGSCR
jgi:hypothetical protein